MVAPSTIKCVFLNKTANWSNYFTVIIVYITTNWHKYIYMTMICVITFWIPTIIITIITPYHWHSISTI